MCKSILPLAMLLAFSCVATSCRTSGKAASSDHSEDAYVSFTPQLMLIQGDIAYDSIQGEYTMTVSDVKKVEGRARIAAGRIDSDGNYLCCHQKNSAGKVISTTNLTNPLNHAIEYHNENGESGYQIVKLQQAPLFVRIQLQPRTETIEFSIGDKSICQFSVNDY